jgi:hypothetical protein
MMGFFGKILGKKPTKPDRAQVAWDQAQELSHKKITIDGKELDASGYMLGLFKIQQIIKERAQGPKPSRSSMGDIYNDMFAVAMLGVAGAMQEMGNSLSDFIQIHDVLVSAWKTKVLPLAQTRQRTDQIKIEVITSAVVGLKVSARVALPIQLIFKPILNFINLS